MLKLYELSEAMNQVAAMMEDGMEGMEEALESIEFSFHEKVESIVKLMRSKAAERDVIDEEKARLDKRAKALDKQVQWLLDYVEREMLRTNTTEVKSALFKIKLAMNPPSVNVLNQAEIPEQFIRTNITVAPDKVAIKEALMNGQIVPGCEIKQDLKLKVK